jgi:hypothetical protein
MDFDINRLRRADRIIGISAILFFIFLFIFKWLGWSASASVLGTTHSASASLNGWHSFTDSRWLWLLTIIVALGAVAISAGMLKIKSPVQPGVLVAALGALSTVLIIYRVFSHPGSGGLSYSGPGYSFSYGNEIGIWLGLIAALGVTYGGYLRMQEEGTSLSDVRDQASGAVSSFSSSSGSGSSSAAEGSTAAGSPAPPSAPAAPREAAPPLPPPAAPEQGGSAPPQQ